jgi:hypothetical protein
VLINTARKGDLIINKTLYLQDFPDVNPSISFSFAIYTDYCTFQKDLGSHMTFSGFDLLFKILPLKSTLKWWLIKIWISVFHLIRESLSEAIKRKLSNGDYKMEKIWDDVGNFTWMCASNDVYILEFFQCTSQYSHLK